MILIHGQNTNPIAQRYFSVLNESEARKVSLLCSSLFVVGILFWAIPPMAARVLYPDLGATLNLPNPDCLEARLLGPYWAGWDVPRHLYIFPRPVLEQLLAETGFQMQEVSSFTGRYHVLVLSTQLWLAEHLASQRLRQLILALMRSWPARALALPWYALADRWSLSSIMTVFARRC